MNNKIKEAYKSGYLRGHEDTINSKYDDPKIAAYDYMQEVESSEQVLKIAKEKLIYIRDRGHTGIRDSQYYLAMEAMMKAAQSAIDYIEGKE